ncbi:inositol monophosphatase family protein [Ensifer soli]|uniref:inositol monophosphatase family protein n=1 Tax=Ciceribacter sp. sgz301302 TaxID=3342379 RepID=UPI0035BB5F66
MSDIDLANIEAFCAELAEGGKAISMRYFRQKTAFEQKEDLSPVTIADQSIEAYMRERIHAAFPDHGIVGEEMEAEEGGRYTWYIDPIDGTKSFISGMPFYGLLAALRDTEEDRTVFGMIDIPAIGERWTGTGDAARFNGAPAKVSACTALADAQIYTTSQDIFSDGDWQVYDRISRAARFRRFGGDCYIYGLLASGYIDLVIETSLKTFDFMALMPIIEGAGGIITDWEGRALTPQSDGRVVAAATRALLDEVLDMINGPGLARARQA